MTNRLAVSVAIVAATGFAVALAMALLPLLSRRVRRAFSFDESYVHPAIYLNVAWQFRRARGLAIMAVLSACFMGTLLTTSTFADNETALRRDVDKLTYTQDNLAIQIAELRMWKANQEALNMEFTKQIAGGYTAVGAFAACALCLHFLGDWFKRKGSQ